MNDEKSRSEEYRFDGGQVIDKVKEFIHQGNVRRITIKNEDGKTLFEIPLWGGVAVVFPQPWDQLKSSGLG
jgi:hypothetical protein